MRSIWIVSCLLLVMGGSNLEAFAQSQAGEAPHIEWEVKNRFRLFRNEADFQRHVAAYREDGVLAAEDRLSKSDDAASGHGQGWAADMVRHLCTDEAGRLTEFCVRDGVREIYLSPIDHRVSVVVAGAPAQARCAWTFADSELPPQQVTVSCDEDVTLRVASGRATAASVDITLPDASDQTAQPALHIATDIKVRDFLIAGLGDSVASGEGNPDRPVVLADEGFCFRRFLGGVRSEYFRPGRSAFNGDKSCGIRPETAQSSSDWARHAAGWMSAACHRSLYSYQLRTALALAIEDPQIAVTYIPLACTGASIENGLFGSQRAREINCGPSARSCPDTVPGQLEALRRALALAQRYQADRKLDLVLLTIGANDIGFSELVANVIIGEGTERTLFERGGLIESVADADDRLTSKLPGNFVKLRGALKPLVDGNLKRVVFVGYANPALHDGGALCSAGRDGFDIHPAFSIDDGRLKEVINIVSNKFLPHLKSLARCEDGAICNDPESDRMTFVDAHQQMFADHGFCARAVSDPEFDVECFSKNGDSFQNDPAAAAVHPLACDHSVSEFRPYASRARWIRTANDSYFTAMTYPGGLPSMLQPSDIHDPIWGTASAVYGGAVHPTAEGHAAMADAALPAVREVLGTALPAVSAPVALPPVPAQ